MAATLTSSVLVRIQALLENALDLVTNQAPLNVKHQQDYASGTSTAQCDVVFSDHRVITTTAAAENLDLQGTLTDAFGAAFTPSRVRALYIKASDGNTADVVVGNVAAGIGFFSTTTSSIALCPGGVLLIVDPVGVTVTATSADLIKVANGATNQGSVEYDVIILGTSAT